MRGFSSHQEGPPSLPAAAAEAQSSSFASAASSSGVSLPQDHIASLNLAIHEWAKKFVTNSVGKMLNAMMTEKGREEGKFPAVLLPTVTDIGNKEFSPRKVLQYSKENKYMSLEEFLSQAREVTQALKAVSVPEMVEGKKGRKVHIHYASNMVKLGKDVEEKVFDFIRSQFPAQATSLLPPIEAREAQTQPAQQQREAVQQPSGQQQGNTVQSRPQALCLPPEERGGVEGGGDSSSRSPSPMSIDSSTDPSPRPRGRTCRGSEEPPAPDPRGGSMDLHPHPPVQAAQTQTLTQNPQAQHQIQPPHAAFTNPPSPPPAAKHPPPSPTRRSPRLKAARPHPSQKTGSQQGQGGIPAFSSSSSSASGSLLPPPSVPPGQPQLEGPQGERSKKRPRFSVSPPPPPPPPPPSQSAHHPDPLRPSPPSAALGGHWNAFQPSASSASFPSHPPITAETAAEENPDSSPMTVEPDDPSPHAGFLRDLQTIDATPEGEKRRQREREAEEILRCLGTVHAKEIPTDPVMRKVACIPKAIARFENDLRDRLVKFNEKRYKAKNAATNTKEKGTPEGEGIQCSFSLVGAAGANLWPVPYSRRKSDSGVETVEGDPLLDALLVFSVPALEVQRVMAEQKELKERAKQEKDAAGAGNSRGNLTTGVRVMRSSGPKKILGGYGGGDWDLQVGALLHSELMKVAKRVLDSSQSDNRVCCQPVGPSEGAQRGVGYVLSFEQIPPSTRKTRALMRVHMQTNTWIIAVQVAYTVQMGKPLDALRESQAQSQLQSQVANKSGGWQRAGGEGEGSAPVFELDSFNLTANDPKTAAQLLMAYLSLNSRVAPLILTVKAWAKERGFFSPWPHNPPAVQTQKGGTSQASAPDVNQKKGAGGSMSVVAGLSGYAWTFLVIFFLLQPAGGPRPVPELIQMFARSGGLGIAEAGGTRTAGAGEEEEKEKEREWNPKEDPVPLPVSSMEVQRSPILPPLQRAVGIERSEGSLRGNAKPEGGGGTGSADSGEGNLVSVVRGRRGELSKGERRSVQEIKKEKKREREAELTECEFFTSWPSSREGGGEAAADASGSAAEVSAAGAGRRRRTGGGGSGGRPPRGGGISWPVFDCPPVSGSSLLRLFSEFLLFLVQTEFQCWVLSVRQGAAIPSSHPALSSFFESGGAMYLEDPVSGENLAASLGADRLREMKTAADLSLRLLDSVLRGEGEGEGHTSAPMPSVEDALTTILGGLPTKGLAGKPVRSLALESLKPVV